MSKAFETAVAKFAIAFVAIAMMFSLVVPAANAQTTEDLQKMINDLLAQVATLQNQLGNGGDAMMASSVCPYTWTRSLGEGDSGMDVMKLQMFLNSDAETMVAAAGAGSKGSETEFYGPATAAAVSKMQMKYRADVLAPAGLVNPTGYFGPSTMAKVNALCVAAPSNGGDSMTDGGDNMTDGGDSSTPSKPSSLSGEASLHDVDLSDGDDTDIEEGQENAPVAEFDIEFEDGDAEINRLDVQFTKGASEDLWDVLEEVTLWVDGDMIASEKADDEDDYLSDDRTLRFTGLDLVAMEDEEVTIVIGVTPQTGIDNLPETLQIDVTSVRFTDADDVTSTEDITVTARSFDVEEEGGEDELKIQASSNDPDADTLTVDEDSKSDWLTVLVFDLDTDDSVNDIVVDQAVLQVEVAGDVYNEVVNDARLVVGGEEFDDVTVSGGTGAIATLTFDLDKDLKIEAGEEVEAKLELRFNRLTGNYSEGQTVVASTSATMGSDWEADGADDLTVGTQLDGSATGETHTLRTEGVIIDIVSVSESTQGDNDTIGTFEVKFSVKAFENDFYIAENADESATNGVNFSVEGPAAPTSVSAVLSSTGDEDTSGVFTVREGETETFTLSVTVDAATAGNHRVLVDEVFFTENTDGVTSVQTDTVDPEEDFRTDYENINQ